MSSRSSEFTPNLILEGRPGTMRAAVPGTDGRDSPCGPAWQLSRVAQAVPASRSLKLSRRVAVHRRRRPFCLVVRGPSTRVGRPDRESSMLSNDQAGKGAQVA